MTLRSDNTAFNLADAIDQAAYNVITAELLSDSVAHPLLCDLARKHGELIFINRDCTCYRFQGVWYILDPEMDSTKSEPRPQERKMSLEDETSKPEPKSDIGVEAMSPEYRDALAEDAAEEFMGEPRDDEAPTVFQVHDLSGEKERVYKYDDGEIRFADPVTLFIGESGSHRVLGSDGWVSYVPPGWRMLQWLPRDPDMPVAF